MITSGNVFDLTLLVVILILVGSAVFNLLKLPRPKEFTVLSVFEEIVGRCAEMGRTLFADPGRWANMTSTSGMQSFAGLSILSHIAGLCARLNVPFVVFSQNLAALPLIYDTLNQPYLEHPDAVKPDLRYIPGVKGNVYSTNVTAQFAREKGGAYISMGRTATSGSIISEGVKVHGGMTFFGTTEVTPMSFYAISCDYVLIGEEFITAGAILGKDELLQSSITAQDLVKFLCIGLIVIGAILASVGSDWLINILNM
jgi:hypothetical protein